MVLDLLGLVFKRRGSGQWYCSWCFAYWWI